MLALAVPADSSSKVSGSTVVRDATEAHERGQRRLRPPHPCVGPDGRALDGGCEPWFDAARAYDAPVHANAAKYLMHGRGDANVTVFFPREGQVVRSDSNR